MGRDPQDSPSGSRPCRPRQTDSPTAIPPAENELPFGVVPLNQTLAKWICPACTGVVSDQSRRLPQMRPRSRAGSAGRRRRRPRSRDALDRAPLLACAHPRTAALRPGDNRLPRRKAPIRSALGDKLFLSIQALLCTPIVVVCGAPFFLRAWRSVSTRRLNLYTLIGLGVGAAYILSLVALVYAWSGTTPLPLNAVADSDLSPEVRSSLEVLAPTRVGAIDSFFESTR